MPASSEGTLQWLLDGGLPFEANDKNEPMFIFSRLHCMSTVEQVRFWIERKGTGLEFRNFEGQTPLMVACDQNVFVSESIVKYLLEAGAQVNAQDDQGRTALMLACQSSAYGVVKLLQESGADPSLQDKRGLTVDSYLGPKAHHAPWDLRTHFQKLLVLNPWQLLEVCKYARMGELTGLLKTQSLPDFTNEEGRGALQIACAYNPHPETIHFLVDEALQGNIPGLEHRDSSQQTALLIAAHFTANPQVLTVLREAGAEVDNSEGHSALQLACRYNSVGVLSELLSWGVFSLEGPDYLSPLDLWLFTDSAKPRYGKEKLAGSKLLVEHGAKPEVLYESTQAACVGCGTRLCVNS